MVDGNVGGLTSLSPLLILYICDAYSLVFAKGLASGMPLSGIASTRALMNKQPAGSQGGTYAGNAVACAAASATIDVIIEEVYPSSSLCVAAAVVVCLMNAQTNNRYNRRMLLKTHHIAHLNCMYT
jgi:acetylornithine/succinyldiaminopimelate/putrescine aminotransferase